MRHNHGVTVVVGEGVRGGGSGGGVRRAAVACGIGERCGGGAALFCDKTLRGEMKRYVKDISGHKFAERGGGRSANLWFCDQHTYNRVENRVNSLTAKSVLAGTKTLPLGRLFAS